LADKLTPPRRSANMAAIKSKDMKPELVVRRIVHALGFRYRLHRKDLPGKPDLVFGSRRKVIFVHGCFWHMHPMQGCLDARVPKSNRNYWSPKLARNVARDVEHIAALKELGWHALVIWECETKDHDAVARAVTGFLGAVN